ncbi:MAG TPA: glycerophosphodiester phosphodiesterase family protein [Candidatus Cybelea sp.]|nr:glycerophosphodiester phosphodiesterase family protein [Candidatus Cybelea sp.]
MSRGFASDARNHGDVKADMNDFSTDLPLKPIDPPVTADATPIGVALDASGHVARLKWHRLKRHRNDLVFTPRRLREGLLLGASMEVDLRVHADHGFVCLHDDTLDRETTGTGPVARASTGKLRQLSLRRDDGMPSDQKLVLLEDLAELARADAAAGATIQLDLKENDAAIGDCTAEAFHRTIASIAGRCILSGGDWRAVCRLADSVAGLRRGFDPCTDDTLDQLRDAADCRAFASEALAVAPEAEMIYLDYRIVLKAAALGIDLVAPFHAAGKAVDAWTLNTGHPDADEALQRLVALRVDQITTDEPVVLQARFEACARSAPL